MRGSGVQGQSPGGGQGLEAMLPWNDRILCLTYNQCICYSFDWVVFVQARSQDDGTIKGGTVLPSLPSLHFLFGGLYIYSTRISYIISRIFTMCFVVWSHIESIKLLLHYQIWLFFSSIRKKTILQFLTDANNSEILENNGSLDIIRIT